METALPLSAYTPTDIKMHARFSSRQITLDDAYALLGMLKEVIDAIAREVAQETGEEVLVLPTVKVSHGSFEIDIDIKGAKWSIRLKAKVRAAFLAAIMAISPGSTDPATLQRSLSEDCRATIESTTQKTMETWKYHGKGYTAEFEVTCGNAKVKSTLHSPQNPRK